jgi:hypothetical protein
MIPPDFFRGVSCFIEGFTFFERIIVALHSDDIKLPFKRAFILKNMEKSLKTKLL